MAEFNDHLDRDDEERQGSKIFPFDHSKLDIREQSAQLPSVKKQGKLVTVYQLSSYYVPNTVVSTSQMYSQA